MAPKTAIQVPDSELPPARIPATPNPRRAAGESCGGRSVLGRFHHFSLRLPLPLALALAARVLVSFFSLALSLSLTPTSSLTHPLTHSLTHSLTLSLSLSLSLSRLACRTSADVHMCVPVCTRLVDPPVHDVTCRHDAFLIHETRLWTG